MAIIVPILTTFNDKGIKSAVREFQTATTKMQKFGAVGKIFDNVGKNLTRNVTAPLLAVGGALALAARGAEQAEIANRKLGSVLTSMGFGEATKRTSAYAEQLERTLAIDADIIKATQTKLATFANLTKTVNESGGAFDRATLAALDLAAAGFGEAETNAVQLGKALQDPIKGITALSRSGVTFTNQEKAKIKTLVESNRVLEAQELILEAIEKQVGGTALAGASSFDRIKLSLMQVADEIGFAVLPLIDELAENVSIIVPRITEQIQKFTSAWQKLSPQVQKTTLIAIGFVAILGPLLIGVSFVIKALILLSRVFVILATSILRIPIAIALLIGIFAAQSDAQYKLAKETGDTWGMISRVIFKGIQVILKTLDQVITGYKFWGVVIEFIGDKVDNFFDKLTGGQGKSLVTLQQRIDQIKPSNLASGLDSAVESFSKFSEEISTASSESKILANDAKRLADETEDLTKGLNKNTDALKKVKEAAKDAAQVIVDNLEESLRKAESGLDDVKGKFDSFRDAITGTITGILNFGRAAESENFLQGLATQAQNATDFANKVKQLVVLGLNERGIRQVLDAGFEAGGQIADEIIAGGATIVQQVNTLVDSIFGVAEQVGEFGAVAFYDAGVKQAEAMVAGIKAALESARADLKLIVDGLATGGTTTGAGDGTTTTGMGSSKTVTVKPGDTLSKIAAANKVSLKSILDANKKFTSDPKYRGGSTIFSGTTVKIPKLAKGGIVTGPTNALIGEAGPEAVIPLSGSKAMGIGSNYYITVNAGIGTSGAQVGREIVDAIKKFEKTSGPVFASA
jgi:hypothetical protein